MEVLENLALTAHNTARANLWRSGAEGSLLRDMADAHGKSREERIAELTPEQDERLRRLIARSDAFNNARTALEDHATGKEDDKSLRRTLAALVEEGERAEEEVDSYKEELGIGPK